jgi:hypothetical protein
MPPRVAPNDGEYRVKILNSGTSVVNLLGTSHCTWPPGFKVRMPRWKQGHPFIDEHRQRTLGSNSMWGVTQQAHMHPAAHTDTLLHHDLLPGQHLQTLRGLCDGVPCWAESSWTAGRGSADVLAACQLRLKTMTDTELTPAPLWLVAGRQQSHIDHWRRVTGQAAPPCCVQGCPKSGSTGSHVKIAGSVPAAALKRSW